MAVVSGKLPSSGKDWRAKLRRLAGFAVIAGSGLAIDTALFLLLVTMGWRSGIANLISAGAAVTFVYFTSVRRIFDYGGRFLLQLFAVYVAYQVIAVAAASYAVDCLVTLGVQPLLSKLAILPATFTANYLAMRLITRVKR